MIKAILLTVCCFCSFGQSSSSVTLDCSALDCAKLLTTPGFITPGTAISNSVKSVEFMRAPAELPPALLIDSVKAYGSNTFIIRKEDYTPIVFCNIRMQRCWMLKK